MGWNPQLIPSLFCACRVLYIRDDWYNHGSVRQLKSLALELLVQETLCIIYIYCCEVFEISASVCCSHSIHVPYIYAVEEDAMPVLRNLHRRACSSMCIELRPTRVSYSLICSSFLEGNDVVHYHEACFVLIWFAYIYVIGTPIAHTYI